MLVNWKIHRFEKNNEHFQSPDKSVTGLKYWFFRYWTSSDIEIDIIDYSRLPLLHHIEKNILKFYVWQSFKGFLRNDKYDVIISHSAQSGVLFAFLRLIFGQKSPPHLIIDPGCFNGARNNILELLPIKLALHSVAGIIYHAHVQESYYKRHLRYLIDRICFVPFGVDTEFFFPAQCVAKPMILAFGSIKRDYGTLLSAWRSLEFEKPELVIVGVDNMRQLGLKDLPKNTRVINRVSIDVLKKMMAEAMFVVIPLPYFGYSYGQMSLLQSMSMGKAVIVTKTPSTIDYVRDCVDAVFAEPYDIADMATKLEFLLRNQSLVERIGIEARRTITARFSEKIMSEKMFQFISKLL